jgi:hypothetical protein
MNEIDIFVYRTVCDHFGIDIQNKTRRRNYVDGRRIYFKILKELNPVRSLASLGKSLDRIKFDHATVLHHLKEIDHFLSIEDDLALKFSNILEICMNFKKDNKDIVFVNNLKYEFKPIREVSGQGGQNAGVCNEVYHYKVFWNFCSSHS